MRWIREEQGSVLVETAIALPLLATILVGAVDYGVLLQQKLRVRSAASAAAAYVTIPANTNDLAGAQQAALLSIGDMKGATASAQRYWTCTPAGNHVDSRSMCSGPRTPMQWVQVDVSASGAPLFVFPGLSPDNVLHTTALERVPWMP